MKDTDIFYFELRSNCKYYGKDIHWNRIHGGNSRKIVDKTEKEFTIISYEDYQIPNECTNYINAKEREAEEFMTYRFREEFNFLECMHYNNFKLIPCFYVDIFSKIVSIFTETKIQNYVNYYFAVIVNFSDNTQDIIMMDTRNVLNISLLKVDFLSKLDYLIKRKEMPKSIVKNGVYDLIFEYETSGILAHEIIGHLSERDSISKHNIWNIGEKLSNHQLTVIDDPLKEDSVASYEFDDEGTESKKVTLIKAGIITNELNNFLNYSTHLNGHGRCTCFNKKPLVRMSNTYIEVGNVPEKNIYKSLENGIVIDKFYRGGIDYDNLSCIIKASGKLIKCGEIDSVIDDLLISEKLSDIFLKIEAIGNKMYWANGCWCRKSEQPPLPVKYGGPILKLSNINIFTKS